MRCWGGRIFEAWLGVINDEDEVEDKSSRLRRFIGVESISVVKDDESGVTSVEFARVQLPFDEEAEDEGEMHDGGDEEDVVSSS